MGQILHARAKTTIVIRKEIQNSTKSIRVLAKEHNVNFKTILKWKHRDDVIDKPFISHLALKHSELCLLQRKSKQFVFLENHLIYR